MTPDMRLLAARAAMTVSLCFAVAACSKSDASKLQHDMTTVGKDVAVDVRKAPESPEAKKADADLKAAAQKAGAAVTQAGDKAKHQIEGATDQAREKVHDATADHHNE